MARVALIDTSPLPLRSQVDAIRRSAAVEDVVLYVSGKQRRTVRMPLTVSERVAVWKDVFSDQDIPFPEFRILTDIPIDWSKFIDSMKEEFVSCRVGDEDVVSIAQFLRNRSHDFSSSRFHLRGSRKLVELSRSRISEFDELYEDQKVVDDIFNQFGAGPFQATDAVVISGARVLVIERGNRPERGTLAFPGGLLDSGETLEACARRELSEEVVLSAKLRDVLENSSVSKVFDVDGRRRDPRGYYPTRVHVFRVDPCFGYDEEPDGRDDARAARFVEISQIGSSDMFADHWSILKEATKD